MEDMSTKSREGGVMKSGIKNNIMTVVTLDLYALLSYRTMTVQSESRP